MADPIGNDVLPFLEKCLDEKITEILVSGLTKPGDNFGGRLFSVLAKVEKNGHVRSGQWLAI